MTSSNEFRVESSHPISSRLFPVPDSQQYFFGDRALAVAMAAKSVTKPLGRVSRALYVACGAHGERLADGGGGEFH